MGTSIGIDRGKWTGATQWFATFQFVFECFATERYAVKGSGERFSSESDLRYDSTQLEDDYFSSDSSNEPNGTTDRTSAQMLADSSEMLATSSGSRLFKVRATEFLPHDQTKTEGVC